jgi:hypothetical protein
VLILEDLLLVGDDIVFSHPKKCRRNPPGGQ